MKRPLDMSGGGWSKAGQDGCAREEEGESLCQCRCSMKGGRASRRRQKWKAGRHVNVSAARLFLRLSANQHKARLSDTSTPTT